MSLSTNLTIDDISSDILYSNGWAISNSTTDPQTSNFWGGTYHSAQAPGASANISFIGNAIYVFGSKGPAHANYTIYFDSNAISLSAYASQTEFQALLFAYSFNMVSTTTHYISIIAEPVPGREWLDIDYVTVTVNQSIGIVGPLVQSSQAAPVSQSVAPPWKSQYSTVSVAASSTAAIPLTTSPSSSSPTTSGLTFILSLVFGSILIMIFLGLILLYIRRLAKSQNTASLSSHPHSPSSAYGRQVSPQAEMARSPKIAAVISRSISRSNPLYRQHGGVGVYQPKSILTTNASNVGLYNVNFDGSSEYPLSRDAAGPEDSNDGRRSPAHSVISRESATVAGSAAILYANSIKGGGGKDGTGGGPINGNATTALLPSSQSISQMPLVAQHRPRSSDAGVTADNDPYRGNMLRSVFSDSRSDINQPTVSTTAAASARLKQKSRPISRPKKMFGKFLGWINEGVSTIWKRDSSWRRRRDDWNSDRTDFLKV